MKVSSQLKFCLTVEILTNSFPSSSPPVLGEMATSAPVLYANTHHPELKVEFPKWTDRHKQIIKRWRGLSVEVKTPFNQKARENRTTLRMKKTQQVREYNSMGILLVIAVH